MADTILLIGSNLGDREKLLGEAKKWLERMVGDCIGQSSIYETAPWGKTDQPGFLNQCMQYSTTLLPGQLLDRCMAIEAIMKRERKVKWGPRTIDIDILFYGHEILNTSVLTLPHPAIAERRFVLIPLAELSPTLLHPVHQKTISELLIECRDPLAATIYNAK